MAYINEYEYTREYAGCEEGGRWGYVLTPVNSVRVRGGVRSQKALAAFNRYLEVNGHDDHKRGAYYASKTAGDYRSGGQIDCIKVRLEAHHARAHEMGFAPYC